MAIQFYSPNDPYGCFSNFSDHPVTIYGRTWLTSEHPFQASKFYPHRPDLVDQIWKALTPAEAARLGRDRSFPLRPDWDAPPVNYQPILMDDGVFRHGAKAEPLFSRTKDIFMYDICKAKFTQHRGLREVLLGTGEEFLIEDTHNDPYWAWGPSRSGHNKLGQVLMLVRKNLRDSSI